MKFLSQQSPLPRLVVTHTRRKAVINEEMEIITLYETTTRVEITLPSAIRKIRAKFNQFADILRSAFLPRVYAY